MKKREIYVNFSSERPFVEFPALEHSWSFFAHVTAMSFPIKGCAVDTLDQNCTHLSSSFGADACPEVEGSPSIT